MRPWPPAHDAALAAHVAQGARLGRLAQKLGRTTYAVSARALHLGLIDIDQLDPIEVIRAEWPAEWVQRCDPDFTRAQVNACRLLWADVFRAAVSDAIDDARRQRHRDPVTDFLTGYISQRSARIVLDLAGLDSDIVLPRLRQLVTTEGLDALKRRMSGFDMSERTSP